jgi:protein-L-isoaspartate O-methyltransferase
MSSNLVRSTAASGSMVYESARAVSEYLLFHFGESNLLMPYNFGPVEATNFPSRVANICNSFSRSKKQRALDIGCAVGGSSFHLSKFYNEVIGMDYSHHFVSAANTMKQHGEMPFKCQKQGNVFTDHIAKLPEGVNVDRVSFVQGDACNLPQHLGMIL